MPCDGPRRSRLQQNNEPDRQLKIEDIQPRLKEALEIMLRLMGGDRGLTTHFITNCAESQAVNEALRKGAKPENIVMRSIKTSNNEYKPACPNSQFWLRMLGVRVIEGDFAP